MWNLWRCQLPRPYLLPNIPMDTRKNFSENYPRFPHETCKFRHLVRMAKSYKSYRFQGFKIIRLPGVSTYLGTALNVRNPRAIYKTPCIYWLTEKLIASQKLGSVDLHILKRSSKKLQYRGNISILNLLGVFTKNKIFLPHFLVLVPLCTLALTPMNSETNTTARLHELPKSLTAILDELCSRLQSEKC